MMSDFLSYVNYLRMLGTDVDLADGGKDSLFLENCVTRRRITEDASHKIFTISLKWRKDPSWLN